MPRRKGLSAHFAIPDLSFWCGAVRRIIKKELGLERDDKDELVQTMTKKLAELNAPPAAEKVITEQLKKISMLEPSSPGDCSSGGCRIYERGSP